MRWCLLFFVTTLSISLRAQTPVIDHLWIDDPTGTLKIIGSFGSDSGNVFIDSVQPAVQRWSPDTIICIIPDGGRGSCGPVRVVNSFGQSNDRLLTAWYLWY